MTAQQLADHRIDQLYDTVKTTSGNKDSDYKMPANEKHLVHARIWTPQFNPNTGQDESVKIVQKFYPDEFQRTITTNGFAGAKVVILHSPDPETKGQEPEDVNKPKIVSQGSGAGVPLDEKLPTDLKSLKAIFEITYPGEEIPKDASAESLEAKIKEKINYLNSDARIASLQVSEQNRLATAGQAASSTQEAKPAGTGAASEGAKVANANASAANAGSTTTAQKAATAAGTPPAPNPPAKTTEAK